MVYEVGRREPFLDHKKKAKDGKPGVSLDWFNMLYQVLLGQEKGPRFGSFVAAYGIPDIHRRHDRRRTLLALVSDAESSGAKDTSVRHDAEVSERVSAFARLFGAGDDTKSMDCEASSQVHDEFRRMLFHFDRVHSPLRRELLLLFRHSLRRERSGALEERQPGRDLRRDQLMRPPSA